MNNSIDLIVVMRHLKIGKDLHPSFEYFIGAFDYQDGLDLLLMPIQFQI
jgi:hypothetical protein